MTTPLLMWFRRDLRLYDNAALYRALCQAKHRGSMVYCVFIFDNTILDKLANRHDRRVAFIHASIQALNEGLSQVGSGLIVLHGTPQHDIPHLAFTLKVSAVYSNRDYEPQAKARDAKVADQLKRLNINFYQEKDQAIFDTNDILFQF